MSDPHRNELDLPPLEEIPRTSFQRWMSRFTFSFVLIAVFLVWKGFNIYEEPVGTVSPQTKQILCYIGAGVSAVLAVLGMRERHRHR